MRGVKLYAGNRHPGLAQIAGRIGRFRGALPIDRDRHFQKRRCRWALRNEGERFVLKNSDHDWQNVAGLFLGGGVKFFAERHDIDAPWPQRSADWWCRVRLPRRDLQFDVSYDFLGHITK